MIWGENVLNAWAKAIGGDLPERVATVESLAAGNWQWEDNIGVSMQQLDQLNVWALALIMSKTHDAAGRPSAPPMLTLTGMAGECAIDWALTRKKIVHNYNKPERDHYDPAIKNHTTCDFEIGKDGPKLEIYTVPAGANRVNAICDLVKLKHAWDLFVVVKLESLDFYAEGIHVNALGVPSIERADTRPPTDHTAVVGKLRICGFAHRLEILRKKHSWKKAEYEYPCTETPGFWRSLESLEADKSHNAEALWRLLSEYESGKTEHPLDKNPRLRL